MLMTLYLASAGLGPVGGVMDPRTGFLGTVHPSIMPAAIPPSSSGVAIDDFLLQQATPCVNLACPAGQSYIYGGKDSGFFCCPEPTTHGDCKRPACTVGSNRTDCACCIFPSDSPSKGCQGATKCSGAPPNPKPKTSTICPIKPEPAPPCVNLTCPAGQSHIYGGKDSGFFCCPEPTTHGDCSSPACTVGSNRTDCACCIFPSPSKGCGVATKCSGAPPGASTVCPAKPPPSPSVQNYFGFGSAMVYNTAEREGGMSLKESVLYHCHNASVNQLSMLIAPPTEGGTISNPEDNDPWQPVKKNGTHFQGNVGMVQAAARFSLMARSCPQATGVVIDDFLQQYVGNNKSSSCVNLTCPAVRFV
jgi:hypothetical protein